MNRAAEYGIGPDEHYGQVGADSHVVVTAHRGEPDRVTLSSLGHVLRRMSNAAAAQKVEIPFPHIPDNDEPSVDDFAAWLTPDEINYSWVASVEGRPVGYVCVGPPGGYLRPHLDAPEECLEIRRLFVDPRFSGRGIGTTMFMAATQRILADGYLPVLSTLSAWRTAEWLTSAEGWHIVDVFDGRRGRQLSFVFNP